MNPSGESIAIEDIKIGEYICLTDNMDICCFDDSKSYMPIGIAAHDIKKDDEVIVNFFHNTHDIIVFYEEDGFRPEYVGRVERDEIRVEVDE